MPDYNESNVSGRQWQRCFQIIISNPLGEQPVIEFSEESVVDIGGIVIRRIVPGCHVRYQPETVVALIDPETGQPTGATVTHAQLYLSLFSAYMEAAAARDAAAAQQPAQ